MREKGRRRVGTGVLSSSTLRGQRREVVFGADRKAGRDHAAEPRAEGSKITSTFPSRSILKVIISAHLLHSQKCSIATVLLGTTEVPEFISILGAWKSFPSPRWRNTAEHFEFAHLSSTARTPRCRNFSNEKRTLSNIYSTEFGRRNYCCPVKKLTSALSVITRESGMNRRKFAAALVPHLFSSRTVPARRGGCKSCNPVLIERQSRWRRVDQL